MSKKKRGFTRRNRDVAKRHIFVHNKEKVSSPVRVTEAEPKTSSAPKVHTSEVSNIKTDLRLFVILSLTFLISLALLYVLGNVLHLRISDFLR